MILRKIHGHHAGHGTVDRNIVRHNYTVTPLGTVGVVPHEAGDVAGNEDLPAFISPAERGAVFRIVADDPDIIDPMQIEEIALIFQNDVSKPALPQNLPGRLKSHFRRQAADDRVGGTKGNRILYGVRAFCPPSRRREPSPEYALILHLTTPVTAVKQAAAACVECGKRLATSCGVVHHCNIGAEPGIYRMADVFKCGIFHRDIPAPFQFNHIGQSLPARQFPRQCLPVGVETLQTGEAEILPARGEENRRQPFPAFLHFREKRGIQTEVFDPDIVTLQQKKRPVRCPWFRLHVLDGRDVAELFPIRQNPRLGTEFQPGSSRQRNSSQPVDPFREIDLPFSGSQRPFQSDTVIGDSVSGQFQIYPGIQCRAVHNRSGDSQQQNDFPADVFHRSS